MTVTLNLKKRIASELLYVEVSEVNRILKLSEGVAGRQFIRMFNSLEDIVPDKTWLSWIINWSPQEGLPLTEMAPWLKLAERVAALKANYEGAFELSDSQADLIYTRLSDSNFKMKGLNPALTAFLLDFYDVMGKRPDGLTDDLMYDQTSSDRS